MTLTADDIGKILKASGIQQWPGAFTPLDTSYVIPTEDWIKQQLTPAIEKFSIDYGVVRFENERNDCDDYALYARTMAHVLNRHNNPEGRKKSIAFGEVILLQDGQFLMDGHDMCFFLYAGKDKRVKIGFYEPQTRFIVKPETNAITVIQWLL